jgi:Plasmid pRiA4b ORF-3-like protein
MKQIYQFKITLIDVQPDIWRTIQVPDTYNFWDLHVAIQDVMGWLDYHLHEFNFASDKTLIRIGMPDEESGDSDTLLGWEINIKTYFEKVGSIARYSYDFGDGWEHQIELEAILPLDASINYPVCIAGERACPPEDCGGVPGFEDMLATLQHGKTNEKKELNEWLKNHAKNYYPYEPEEFDPQAVKFDDPEIRWANAFG